MLANTSLVVFFTKFEVSDLVLFFKNALIISTRAIIFIVAKDLASCWDGAYANTWTRSGFWKLPSFGSNPDRCQNSWFSSLGIENVVTDFQIWSARVDGSSALLSWFWVDVSSLFFFSSLFARTISWRIWSASREHLEVWWVRYL